MAVLYEGGADWGFDGDFGINQNNTSGVVNSTGISSNMISAGIGAIGTLFGVSAMKADINARTEAAIRAIELETQSYKIQRNILAEQEREVDTQLYNAMSQRGLEALKAEGRLRAAAAETGTSGGTTDYAIEQSWMDSALDIAILTSRAKSQKVDLYRRGDMQDISLENKLEGFVSSIPSSSSAGISVASTVVSGLGRTYNMLGASAREELFNWGD